MKIAEWILLVLAALALGASAAFAYASSKYGGDAEFSNLASVLLLVSILSSIGRGILSFLGREKVRAVAFTAHSRGLDG